jgi:hypothetical protein
MGHVPDTILTSSADFHPDLECRFFQQSPGATRWETDRLLRLIVAMRSQSLNAVLTVNEHWEYV